jgi:transposase
MPLGAVHPSKIHMIVDALGNPVAMSLTPGQQSDLSQAAPLLEEVEPEAFLADKAYDADALIEVLADRSITAVIPSKANRLVRHRLRDLQRTKPCRAVLLQTQRFQSNCNPL